jgi:hypothetical protein
LDAEKFRVFCRQLELSQALGHGASVLLGGLPLDPPEPSFELRQGLETHLESNFADPPMWILE